MNPNAPEFDPIAAQADRTSREAAEKALEGEDNKPLGQGRRRKSRKTRKSRSKKTSKKTRSRRRRRGGASCSGM